MVIGDNKDQFKSRNLCRPIVEFQCKIFAPEHAVAVDAFSSDLGADQDGFFSSGINPACFTRERPGVYVLGNDFR